MACLYYKFCDKEKKSSDCTNSEFTVLCYDKKDVKKEYELRQESIKRLLEKAKKLNW